MRTLSDEEKAYWREIASEVADVVVKQHVESCPYGKTLTAWQYLLKGIGIGAALAGGGIGVKAAVSAFF